MSFEWLDIIVPIIVPLTQQVLKLLSESFDIVLNKWQNQLLTLVLTVLLGLVGGEFMLLEFCPWSDDLMLFIGCNLTAVGAAWAIVSASYELLWDKLFVAVSKSTDFRLVTKDKL